MPKIAILGANGQVGAELCLLLGRVPEVELVPVCRSRSGSAFLRWQGVACRHGRPADNLHAAALFSDCDAVVNCALATGSPRAMRRAEDRIIEAMVRHSRPDAVLVHFSTQNVYGDPRPAQRVRWRSLYGRAKLSTERHLARVARATGRQPYVFRLGHVCGALQDISNSIREEIRRGEVILPERDHASNTVYTVTLRDAIVAAVAGKVAPGTYDLMNVPQWTWAQVYEYEAHSLGEPLAVRRVAAAARAGFVRGMLRAARGLLAGAAGNSFLRQLVGSLIAHLPESLSQRGHAWWHCVRARRQIGDLATARVPAEHLSWVANGTRFPAGITPTRTSLQTDPYRGIGAAPAGGGVWPPDLPPASTAGTASPASTPNVIPQGDDAGEASP